MTEHCSRRSACRVCGGTELHQFLDLGKHPLSDAFVSADQIKNKKELYFPLSIHVCKTCNHMQLLDVVDARLLFPEEYALFSSTGPALVKHFNEYAQDIHAKFGSMRNKLVIEIASNDGALLAPLKERGFVTLGIEPTLNTAAVARSRGIEVITEFFSESLSRSVVASHGKAGIVSANNVLAHVDEPADFVCGVKNILDEKGVFVFEVQHGLELIRHTEFDNIYHEHLSFFALRPLMVLMEKCGMKIFDVKLVATQGGSLRCYATHVENNAYPVTAMPAQIIAEEIACQMDNLDTYDAFGKRALAIKTKLREVLQQVKQDGKRVVGYGAPAKGNTLLNFCGIGPDIIDYCIEKTPFKFGKFTPGMHIPVVSDEIIKKDGPPDYYLLLIWNYLDAILAREKAYLAHGGQFIVAIPNVRIIKA